MADPFDQFQPRPSLRGRIRNIRSMYGLVRSLAEIESEVIETIARDLEQARQDTIDRLARQTGTLDMSRAMQVLAEIERQQAEFELLWENLVEDCLRASLEGGQAMPEARLREYGIEIFSTPLISQTFHQVAVATLPILIKGLGREYVDTIGRMLRQAVLAQSTPLDVIRDLGRLPPFQRFDPRTGRWVPLSDADIRLALKTKGPYAKLFRRLESIVRTEMGRITQTANYLTLRELSANDKRWMKEWSSVHDARTRPSHARADGQRVPVDMPFHVGSSLMAYPLDPRAPAEETINCRCVSQPWHPAFEDPSQLGDGMYQTHEVTFSV